MLKQMFAFLVNTDRAVPLFPLLPLCTVIKLDLFFFFACLIDEKKLVFYFVFIVL